VSLRRNLARALIWQGRYDDAIAESQAFSAIDSKLAAEIGLGWCFFSVGEIDRAFDSLQKEIKESSSNFHNILLVGTIHYKRGQKEQAFEAFREYLLRAMNELEFKRTNVYTFIAETRIALESIGSAKDVIATYRKAIEAVPSPPRDQVVLSLGEFLLQEGMVDEALTLYREELAARREHSTLARKLAEHFLQSGRTDEALAVYREGIQAIPQCLGFHRELTALLKEQGKDAEWNQEVDKFISLLRAALERKFDVWGQAELAELYLRRGRRDEAREQYRILIKKSTHHNRMNFEAMSLSASRDAKDRDGLIAVELATRVCELTGWSNSMYLDTLATTYAEVGDFDAAVKWQLKAIEYFEKPDEIEDYRSRLKLYQEKKPCRYPESNEK
jgi:tetratricopeptide (TPR) repeat protein